MLELRAYSSYIFTSKYTFTDVVGVPVFYFVLPIYSFWHMDDFSWGTTRQTADTDTDDSSKVTTTGGETDKEEQPYSSDEEHDRRVQQEFDDERAARRE